MRKKGRFKQCSNSTPPCSTKRRCFKLCRKTSRIAAWKWKGEELVFGKSSFGPQISCQRCIAWSVSLRHRHSQEAQLLKDLLNEARSQAAAEKEALQRQQSKISELDSQVARLHRKAEQQANAEEALKKQLLEEQRRLAKTEKDFDDRLAAAQVGQTSFASR